MTATEPKTEPKTAMTNLEALALLNQMMTELEKTTDPVARGRLATKVSAFAKDELMPVMTAVRQEAVLALYEEGESFGSIGKKLGLSSSRAFQLVTGRG